MIYCVDNDSYHDNTKNFKTVNLLDNTQSRICVLIAVLATQFLTTYKT